MITLEQLRRIMPYAGERAEAFLDPLNQAMAEFGIDTPQRQAAFLSQIAHESGSLRYVREIASGATYEGRRDLGNTEPGDGMRFKGRGLLQITGRHNYTICSIALYGDERLLDKPWLLESVVGACRSAAWYWSAFGLNEIADAGDIKRMTRRINGGLNGLAERQAYYAVAKEVLA
jgi:putative chitinase